MMGWARAIWLVQCQDCSFVCLLAYGGSDARLCFPDGGVSIGTVLCESMVVCQNEDGCASCVFQCCQGRGGISPGSCVCLL